MPGHKRTVALPCSSCFQGLQEEPGSLMVHLSSRVFNGIRVARSETQKQRAGLILATVQRWVRCHWMVCTARLTAVGGHRVLRECVPAVLGHPARSVDEDGRPPWSWRCPWCPLKLKEEPDPQTVVKTQAHRQTLKKKPPFWRSPKRKPPYFNSAVSCHCWISPAHDFLEIAPPCCCKQGDC